MQRAIPELTMIEQTSFLGLPLRTQAQRRRLVWIYYASLLGLTVLYLWKPHPTIGPMLAQVVFLGGLLGGIRVGGPVKPYSEPGRLEGNGPGELTTLNLSGQPRPFRLFSPLDERERHERDQAHYRAYVVLRWTVLAGAFVLALTSFIAPAWLAGHAAALLWAFVVYLLSLPQSVVLWTEPSAAPADLIELPVA